MRHDSELLRLSVRAANGGLSSAIAECAALSHWLPYCLSLAKTSLSLAPCSHFIVQSVGCLLTVCGAGVLTVCGAGVSQICFFNLFLILGLLAICLVQIAHKGKSATTTTDLVSCNTVPVHSASTQCQCTVPVHSASTQCQYTVPVRAQCQ